MRWSLLSLCIVAAAHGFTMKMKHVNTNKNGNGIIHHFSRRAAIQSTLAITPFILALHHPNPSLAAYMDPSNVKITKRVFLDVQIGNAPPRRLVIGLFGDVTPRLVENFETLCRQNDYAGTTFYRVLSNYSIQGGAIGDESGKSGKSAFQESLLEPDNFHIRHNQAGLVSMVRGVGGSVDSRFFITSLDDAAWADDRYAAFGIVEEGMNLVHDIEKVDVKPPQNAPKVPVHIVASGVL